MKRFAAWLLAPWRGVTRSGLTPERKAALVGISATVGLLYGGWLLLATKDALNERNALAVILAPDYRVRFGGQEASERVERSSLRCRVSAEVTGPAPSVLGCFNWRRPVAPPPATVFSYWLGRSVPAPTFLPQRGTWRGDYRELVPAREAVYGGHRRADGIRSIRDDFTKSVFRLAVPGGVALAVMIGVSTGFHYLRKTRGEDDV